MSLGEQINKIYDKRGFLEKHGNDVIFAIVIAFILISVNVYFFILNNLKGLKKKWNDPIDPINCKPIYIPFASVINPPADGNDLQYIEDNLNKCAKKSLGILGKLMTNPIQVVLDSIIEVLKDIALVLESFIKTMGDFVDALSDLISQLNVNFTDTIDSNNDFFSKILNSLTKFMTINKVVAYVMQGFSDFGMSLLNSINPAACFDKHTMLSMADGSIKSIQRITVGDRLLHDGIVTSIMKLSSTDVDMYTYKDIIVSGSHYVYENNKFIMIRKSKNAIRIPHYNDKFIWCINTASKQIHINDIVFADYDDLSKKDCNYLKDWIRNRCNKQIISNYDIHSYMNGGLMDTSIKTHNGTLKMLSEIEIGDILYPNIKVLGIVEILPTDLKMITLNINKRTIIGGTNIQIIDKLRHSSYNFMDCMDKGGVYTNKPLYHLITNKGGFYINNIFIGDYSMGMSLFFKEDRQSILSVI